MAISKSLARLLGGGGLGVLGGAALPGIGGAGETEGGGGFLRELLLGAPGRREQFPRFTPEQKSALDRLLSEGMEGVSFAPIEERARRGFAEETIPSLAERFTAMGGGQRSAAFRGALGRAGAGLETGLGALRSQLGMQQLGMGLQPQFESAYFPRQAGMLEAGAQSLGQLLPLLMYL